MANAIVNPGFETAPPFVAATTTNQRWIDGTAAGNSSATSSYYWGLTTANGSFAASFDTSTFNSGSKSLKLSTTAVSSFLECRLSRADIASFRTGLIVPVLPNTAYTLTFYMKTNYVSGDSNNGASLNVGGYDSTWTNTTNNGSANVKTTTGWTQYTINFTTGPTTVYIEPSLRIYGHTGTGTLIMDAWFDDLFMDDHNGNFVMYNNMGMGR